MLFSRLVCSVVQLSVQRQPCCAGLHLALWVMRWSVCREAVQVIFSAVPAACTAAAMLNSCSSRFFPRFQLGDTWTLRGLAVEGTEKAFILHLETCVRFKLECKLGIVNGFSLAGQSNRSHRGVEVIFICESSRCRAELQRVLLVKHEPCWQCCVESGVFPGSSVPPRLQMLASVFTPHLQSPLQSLTAILTVPPCGKY